MPCWIALQTCITTEPGAAVMDEAAVQRALASIALGFTPRVVLLDEAVLMDVTGSLRLFGGLARLMRLLEQRLALFFKANELQAQTRRAQGATSLIALGRLRLPAGPAEAARLRVAELPMHTLSAARPHLGVLERIGCRSWDDLLRLPRDGVARRFGAPLLEALDRARGKEPDGYEWRVLPEHFEEKLELDALVTHAPALMAGVERLLVNLQAWLLGRQSGLSALKLVWHLDPRRDVPPTGELEIRTAQPAQDLRHVARLLAEHLAQQKLAAPVHSLTLQSLVTEKLVDSAAATGSLLMAERRQGDSALELVERLSARLGDEQVQAWQPNADHRPEQMQRWVNARRAIKGHDKGAIKSIAGSARFVRARGRNDQKNEPDASTTEALYPSWLLPEPLKLATVGDSPVYQGRLVRLAGPQRLEATGWLMGGDGTGEGGKPPAIRDYFIYRSQQAGLLWVYSERLPVAAPQAAAGQLRAWYLHGFFA
ncbi:DNA polymerase Y family protein [Polaromonas sp.]|uniref:Y-family DNA polymerase n=1 Tax=Polaromonas sp. TaxID=1869339 RepID=UPI00286C6E6C|nr:DNA polymerase Y family protein [Polaromonas sp.]